MTEGISYLVKQFGNCTCCPQSCIADGSSYSCCNGPPIEKKVVQHQILSLKSKDFGWRNGK